jgi:hypothetical protein
VKGHALIAVSCAQYRRDVVAGRRDEMRLFEEGLLPREKLGKLREWIDREQYVALECTGVALTERPGELPERIGRESGRMLFERATRAGREQLDADNRPFLYALDVHELQRTRRPYPISGVAGYDVELYQNVEHQITSLHSKLVKPIGLSRVVTLRIKSLKDQLVALEEEYDAVTEAIQQTIEPVTLVKFERQGQHILRRMEDIEAQLNQLNSNNKVAEPVSLIHSKITLNRV